MLLLGLVLGLSSVKGTQSASARAASAFRADLGSTSVCHQEKGGWGCFVFVLVVRGRGAQWRYLHTEREGVSRVMGGKCVWDFRGGFWVPWVLEG